MGKKEKWLIVLFSLFLMNLLSWSFLFSLRDAQWKIVFFDVGQGDAIFIKTPSNHHILIDGGPGDKVLEKLSEEKSFFNNSLDLVILTHSHYDHVSGLIEVLEHYEVEEIVCTGAFSEQKVSQKWKSIIREKGYRQARAGKRIRGEGFYMDILYPFESFKEEKVEDLNTISVVSRLVFEDGYTFLFTGDAYKQQEKEILSYKEKCSELKNKEVFFQKGCDLFSLDTDVLKVGHHGSRSSTSEEFLSIVSPGIAVIMAGENNPYDHPHGEVLEKLKRKGVIVKRTDKHGDVVFKE